MWKVNLNHVDIELVNMSEEERAVEVQMSDISCTAICGPGPQIAMSKFEKKQHGATLRDAESLVKLREYLSEARKEREG